MSWIDELFGGGREAAAQAMGNQIGQGMNQANNAMNPYLGNQQNIYNQYLNAINQGQNPIDLYNQFAKSYQMSPEAQAQIKQGQLAANRASAASGMLGSGAEQTAAASRAQSVRSNDFENYMNHLMGIRNQYLGGMGGLEGQGFQGSEFLSQLMQKYFEDKGNAAAAGQEGQSQGITGAIGTGLGFLGQLFGG